MRWVIAAVAVVCFAAALAVLGAGLRVPDARPTVAEAPPAPPASVLSAPPPAGLLPTTVEDLAREQATSRELVTELRASVALLQEQLARQRPPGDLGEAPGKTVAVLCCELLPAGQETLAPGVGAVVRAVLPEIAADTRQVVSVEGHSDSRPIRTGAGKPFKDNADLSLRRARAVAALLQEHGVARGRIRVKGWGDTRPLAANDTAEGRDRNRRVEIRLLPPSPQR